MKDRNHINKLILIGNGFDLAHGLKTSYQNFIDWYFDQTYEKFKKQNSFYEDDLVKLQLPEEVYGWKQLQNPYSEYYRAQKNVFEDKYEKEINVKFKNNLWENLLTFSGVNKWIDIEQFYYDEFRSVTREILETSEKKDLKPLFKLNTDLKQISQLLKTYLNDNIQLDRSMLIEEFQKIIFSKDTKLILNFNYTNTVYDYLNNYDYAPQKEIIVPLHGNIDDKDYPLVFGFGDEKDKLYQDIEDLNENQLMDHFKSFAYFRNPHYSNLLSFIDTEPFEVYTIGLSCGLSDRTLLSQIFEHNNCEKIHVMYYDNEQNYQDIARNISRHFSDKQELRRKLVNYKDSTPCPQLINKRVQNI